MGNLLNIFSHVYHSFSIIIYLDMTVSLVEFPTNFFPPLGSSIVLIGFDKWQSSSRIVGVPIVPMQLWFH